MLKELVEVYHAGGFVMPPLLLGAAILWYAMTYRGLLLTGASFGIFSEFQKRLNDLISSRRNKNDAFIMMAEVEEAMNKFKTVMKTVVIIAPLLGLLGTVSGMIETFDSLAEMSLFSQSGGIAGGISQALVSTQMGLAVAIPGLICGRLLERRQTSLLNNMEELIERHFNEKGVQNA